MAAAALHLTKRFLGALRTGGPRPDDEAWVASVLGPDSGQHALWQRMSGPDRRHAVGVARAVDAALPSADPPILAAALLHDVGKVESGLGTLARVPVTLVGMAGGRTRAPEWERRGGLRGRVGRYLRHAPRGGALLTAAGADPLTAAWAAEHHLPVSAWTVPVDVGRVLKAADDD